MSQFVERFNSEFNKIIDHFKGETEKLKAGRATPALVEDLLIESYGVKTPLKQVGSISVPEPSLLVIEPWDKNLLKEIEKALSQSNLDLSISISETAVRGKISPLTEEKRKQIIKLLNDKKEEAKVSLRQIRDKIRKEIEQNEKDKEISEDDKFNYQKELDEIIKNKTQEIEDFSKKKEEEIMTV
jgi:ribosome recycling factor